VRRSSGSVLRIIALIFIFAAVLLTVVQLVQYSRIRNTFPPGMTVAGVPVGGLNQEQAASRISQAYGIPVELHYGDSVIQIRPSLVGFELDLQSMLAAADLQRIDQPFWSAFWDYLWNRLPQPGEVPLRANLSEDRLRVFLTNEIASRYDQPAVAAMPMPGTENFDTGSPGTTLDIDRAVLLIEDALRSPNSRVVNLTFKSVNAPRPSIQHLEALMKQEIAYSGFEGVIEVFLMDLQTQEEINFAYQNGEDLTTDIAFTAASTMKIPIMVSVFKRLSEPTSAEMVNMIELMIERSENEPADQLMQVVMDSNLGPLEVTEDMQAMGLKNTFMAGYFYPGAPLLQRIETPANLRDDITTGPDPYNQTTATEIGLLLHDIYQCSQNGGGTLAAVFPGLISQQECQQMISYLSLNDIPVLLQGGLPEGTRIAHKHGWILEFDGLQHMMADAGIVFAPGGNYIMTVFMYHPVQLIFDPANDLVINLSRSAYNYFNISQRE
jgi:hypothetical protein